MVTCSPDHSTVHSQNKLGCEVPGKVVSRVRVPTPVAAQWQTNLLLFRSIHVKDLGIAYAELPDIIFQIEPQADIIVGQVHDLVSS